MTSLRALTKLLQIVNNLMSKKTKKVKQLDKDCLSFVQAILEEDAKSAASVLKTIVKKNIAKKLKKAERETDLF